MTGKNHLAKIVRPGCRLKARVLGRLTSVIWLSLASPLAGADEPQLEHKVKAACLYNFAANTEWPVEAFATPDAPLVVGLVGEVPFGALFERGVQDKTVQGRRILVRHLDPSADPVGCHVLFLAALGETRLASLLAIAAAQPVLTVGEAEGFAQSGGIINFIKVGGSVRFEVNTAAAARAHLKLGSQLLKLAVIVKDGGKPKKE